MSILSAENNRALQILRLVTEQVEELAAVKLENLELREANRRLLDELELWQSSRPASVTCIFSGERT